MMPLRKVDVRRISKQLNNLSDGMDDQVIDMCDDCVVAVTEQNRQAYAFYSHLRDIGW